MQETDAIIGGESSGGLTVKAIYTERTASGVAALLVEMIAVSGKRLSDSGGYQEGIWSHPYGGSGITGLRQMKRNESINILMEERKAAGNALETDHVSYMDGCKVYLRTAAGLLPDSLVRNLCFAYSVRWRGGGGGGRHTGNRRLP